MSQSTELFSCSSDNSVTRLTVLKVLSLLGSQGVTLWVGWQWKLGVLGPFLRPWCYALARNYLSKQLLSS